MSSTRPFLLAILLLAPGFGGGTACSPKREARRESPPSTDTAPDSGPACRTQGFSLDPGAGKQASRITWERCGPSEPTWTSNGSAEYPKDTVKAGAVVLYSNSEYPDQEGVSALKPIHLGQSGSELLLVVRSYGTGNVHDWKVMDLHDGKLREWTIPDLQSALQAKLKGDEQLGKEEGDGPQVEDGSIVLGHVVYKPGEPLCCPTGGVVRIKLSGEDGALRIVKTWREPQR